MFTTADARALFGGSTANASQTLAALANEGLALQLRRGLWALDRNIDRLSLPEVLSAPAPSYVSLLTALYRHGVIEQVPAVVYAVTLGRTKRYETTLGTFSLHQVAPELFGGFELSPTGAKLATTEKALVDVAYLSGVKSRLFTEVPEIELPKNFDLALALAWIARIPSRRHRTLAKQWFEANVLPHVPLRRGRRPSEAR